MSANSGSCLCGSIKLAIRGDPVMTNLCHCTTCQKFSGSVFASLSVYKTKDVTITESEPSIMKMFEDRTPESGRVLYRWFCGKCGSPVRGTRADSDELTVVPVGIIDHGKASLKPTVELFCKSKVNWVGDVDGAELFAALP
ncbi:Mss4-like protein [Xylariaceae sp. FL0255]|nr:Mss4-like protein [Xylariaceae sp. FL0255]